MQLTGSISRGKTAEKHNTRECYPDPRRTPENIDPSRSAENVILINRNIEDVYREMFDAATDEYNAKQVEKGHPERQIDNYLEKVRADKKLKPMYEFVVQVGNMEEKTDEETAQIIYEEWVEDFRERFGAQFVVKQAIVHVDEATPHMHLEVVPRAESKRGLSVQNSLNKAIKQAGFEDYKTMLASWDGILTECMARHGIERVAGNKEKQMGGVSIDEYKRSMAVRKETKTAEERLECLRQRIAEKEKLEPVAETVSESIRTLYTARSDGKRAEALEGDVNGLRSRVRDLETANQRSRERIGELDGKLPSIRGRNQELAGRFEAIERRVKQAITKLREVPTTLSDWALEIARRLGKRVYNPLSLDYQMQRAVEAAAASVSYDRERGRGLGRGR